MYKSQPSPYLSCAVALALSALTACDQGSGDESPDSERTIEDSTEIEVLHEVQDADIADDDDVDAELEDTSDVDDGEHEDDAPLSERPVPNKDNAPMVLPEDLTGAELVIKFAEGTDVQQDGPILLSPDPVRMGIDDVEADLAMVMETCESAGLNIEPLFTLSRQAMTVLKVEGEYNVGQELADLSLYFNAKVTEGLGEEELRALLSVLNGLEAVEIAYVQPQPKAAALVSPPDANTPNFQGSQGYMGDDDNGIALASAWTRTGGRGDYVRIIDVEGSWVEDHEDLPTAFYHSGEDSSDPTWIDHGTAVAGVLAARENGYGITGILPNTTIGYAGIFGPGRNTARAILDAADQLDPGDILLVEVQYGGGPVTTTCTCNFEQCNDVPVEYFQAEFDAIQTATAKGIIVVEPAGNGSINLDHPAYGGVFNRQVRNSGAIFVGASLSTSRSPACFTNYGDRVDLHAWGENVMTLGYGDAYQGQLGLRDEYTASFSGTSSASPIVVGAIGSLQSIAYTRSGPMTSQELLSLLQATGTPQDPSTTARRIGPMPDLAAAIAMLGW